MATQPDFVTESKTLVPQLVKLRRTLHRDPELGLELPRTQAHVLEALKDLDLEITTGTKTTSVVAVLRGGKEGPTVLLRGDMDGLPMVEETGLDYASTTENMHSCGHDMHTAGLVGAAELLSKHKKDLPGKVIFMFQPGEEGFGGAQIMIDEGVLDVTGERPIGAYAIHVAPGPRGFFGTRVGPMAAGSNQAFITVRGRGGHGSQPHLTLDPVTVAAEIVMALQTFVARRFDSFDPIVFSVTRFKTGEGAVNVTPEKVEMAATIRTLTAESLEIVQTEMPVLVQNIAIAHGATADVDFQVLYPPTVNNAETTMEAVADMRAVFGDQRVMMLPSPLMGSEDFAFVTMLVPGTFIGLGATPLGMPPSDVEFNHSPRVVFDDAILGDQAAALATVAWGRLSRAAAQE